MVLFLLVFLLCDFFTYYYLFFCNDTAVYSRLYNVEHRVKSVRSWCDGSSDRSAMEDPFELYLIPASAPRLVYQRPRYVLSMCLWDDAYKRTLVANGKE